MDTKENTSLTVSKQPNQDSYMAAQEDEINLLDLMLVILKHKKMIIKIVAAVFILSIIISLIIPKKYTAIATILPPVESASSVSGILAQAGGALGGLAGSLMGANTPADLFVGILQSRTVADNLINRFNLKEVFDTEYMEDLYKTLEEHVTISISNTNQIISVAVEEKDPQLAADMANTYVEMLDQLNRRVNVSEGRQKRVFLEKRLEKVTQDLGKAETELKEFQEKYKLISIQEQARATLEGAARIKAEIISAQTEFEVLKQFGTEKQNEAVMLKSKIEELQRQLVKMETGEVTLVSKEKNTFDNRNSDLFIPFDELPELGLELARLMREAKIQESVFELMTTQYELAKIEEAKDVNTIQVLDKAAPPDKKSSPKRSIIVVLSTFMAFFIAIFMAFIKEFVERIEKDDHDRYIQIKTNLIFWK